jgi:hypothetical protein
MADGTLEGEFARTSDDFMGDLDRLRELEREKRSMAPGDPARTEIAVRIEEATLDLFGRSQFQTHLAQASEQPDGQERRSNQLVLRDWRDAEARLREAQAVLRGIAAETAGYREEYLRNVDDLERSSED